MKKINIKTILSISEARKRIFEIAKKVQKRGVHYIFTENGRPKAVMMSAEEFDSLMEDLEILNNPEVLENIKNAGEEIRKGDYVTLDELKKEFGYTSADLQPSFVRERPVKGYKVKKQNNKGGKKDAR